jgi:hypothetical protein
MTIAPSTLALGNPFESRPFEARALPIHKRARAVVARLRWAIAAMALLNLVVWGGMIATARGMIDVAPPGGRGLGPGRGLAGRPAPRERHDHLSFPFGHGFAASRGFPKKGRAAEVRGGLRSAGPEPGSCL